MRDKKMAYEYNRINDTIDSIYEQARFFDDRRIYKQYKRIKRKKRRTL